MPRTIRFLHTIPLSALLMILAIIGIAGFQAYWMRNLYRQEWMELKKETDVGFRDVVYKLQIQHFRQDTMFTKHDLPPNLFLFNLLDSMRTRFVDSFGPPGALGRNQSLTISIHAFGDHDSGAGSGIVGGAGSGGGLRIEDKVLAEDSGAHHLVKFYNSRAGAEAPLSLGQIDSAYRKELAKNHITVPFRIERKQSNPGELDQPPPSDKLLTSFVYVGLSNSYAYQASFDNPVRYILGRMLWSIVAGLLLLGFTVLTFVVLYRNLQQQQRLAQFKNDFISNMTHELKTPISTIKVAVEALRNFHALDDPKRTREYLDISALELQRLSLLVDKVVKLSQLENRVIEFRLLVFDLRELAAEVIADMRLPFEQARAVVQLVPAEGRFEVLADRAHLSSVLSNLLDNALKYSKEGPVITVQVSREDGVILLSVTDNGIGIPAAYLGRIFDKFFRVPSGDHHNIKGHGLGLNYANHIVVAHRGRIVVESKEGKGSTFTIKLPAV